MSVPGITFLDHTADLGMDVGAGSLEELLHRAALGMMALLRGEEEDLPDGGVAPPPEEEAESIPMTLRAAGTVELLAHWLREILFLHGVQGLDYAGLEVDRLDERALDGRIRVRRGGHAVREIKGVTYHGLRVEQRAAGGWTARVIFDV